MKYNVLIRKNDNKETAILVADYPYNKLYESIDWCNSNDLKTIIKDILNVENSKSTEFEFGGEQVDVLVKGSETVFNYNYRPVPKTDFHECDSNIGLTKNILEILDVYLDTLLIIEKRNAEKKELNTTLESLKIDIYSGIVFRNNKELNRDSFIIKKFENKGIKFDIETNLNSMIITLDPAYCNKRLDISGDDFKTVAKKIETEINRLMDVLLKSKKRKFNWGEIKIHTDPRIQNTYAEINYKKTVYNKV